MLLLELLQAVLLCFGQQIQRYPCLLSHSLVILQILLQVNIYLEAIVLVRGWNVCPADDGNNNLSSSIAPLLMIHIIFILF